MREKAKSGILFKISQLVIVLSFVTLPGCERSGSIFCLCTNNVHWTNDNTNNCYATQAECEADTGEHCYKCN
jgi:hypothetical protein